MAIEQALLISTWFENLSKDEVPPEHLWEDPEGLEQWWESVEAKRSDDGMSTSRGHTSDDDDSSDHGFVENDHARFLKNM